MYYGERLNSLTHLLGLILALAGTGALVTQAVQGGDGLRITSFTVFGVSMVLLYAASTLYHSRRGPSKARWAKADHCAIYLLIAGTYTPFSLVTLRGPRGWLLFGVVWSLATLGIGKAWRAPAAAAPSPILYLLMGWCGMATAIPLVRGLPGHGWAWLLGGCLCYSLGLVFYGLGQRVMHAHGIWHLFVLGGTASHFITVLRFVR